MTSADNDRVPGACGKFVDRGGQADFAEQPGSGRHAGSIYGAFFAGKQQSGFRLLVMDFSKEIDALQQQFGIAGLVEIVAGNGGLPKIRIKAGAGAAEIYLHGAQVTSWVPTGGDEVIFLSKQSRWEDGKAIRGGIPICFPWFRAKADDPAAPAHGLVRTKAWNLIGVAESADGVVVTLATENDAASMKWWPHAFRIVHRVTVGPALKLELLVRNTGDAPFTIEEALHTYHAVSDVENVRVEGLSGVHYLDNMDGNVEKMQAGDVVLTAATDNAYLATRSAVVIVDPGLRRRVTVEKENSATTIVWNPWALAASKLADLGDEEWHGFICVEASNILQSAVVVRPGVEHRMSAVLRVE